MKERLALIVLAILGWTLVVLSAVLDNSMFFAAYFAIGVMYAVILEGKRIVPIFGHAVIGLMWLVMVTLGTVLCWMEPYRSKPVREFLRMTQE